MSRRSFHTRLAILPALFSVAASAHAAPWTLTKLAERYGTAAISVPYVVWTANREGLPAPAPQQLMLHDIDTGDTIEITNEPGGAMEPTIDGHHIAFRTDHGLMLYDLKKQVHTPIPGSAPGPGNANSGGGSPRLKANHVAFIKYERISSLDVFLFDIPTGETTQITEDGGTKFQLCASDRYIVWQLKGAESAATIQAYDIAKKQIIDVSGKQDTCDGWPKVAGDSVVFLRRNARQTKVEGIFLFDLKKKTLKKVNTVFGEFFDTDGHSVVYSGSPDGDLPVAAAIRKPAKPDQVYQYDIATGATKQLTNTPYASNEPKIQGNIMTWATTDKNHIVAFDGKTVEPFVKPLDNPPGTVTSASGGVFNSRIDKGVILVNVMFNDKTKRRPGPSYLYMAQQNPKTHPKE